VKPVSTVDQVRRRTFLLIALCAVAKIKAGATGFNLAACG
jgi:hypothetical protein